MTLTNWIGVGAALAVVVAISALVRRRRVVNVKDLGSVSDQWLTEQRTHDGEWRDRWG